MFCFYQKLRTVFYRLLVNKLQNILCVCIPLANYGRVRHGQRWHKHRQKSLSARDLVSDSVMTIK